MSRLLISQYYSEVDKIAQYGGSVHEGSISNVFAGLLNGYCKTQNYLLIPQLEYRTKFGTPVRPDGTVKDAIRLDHGWWESKDKYDKLDEEIEKKLAKGYPDENILFEDSQTAVLIQHGQEHSRVLMRDDPAGLDKLLNSFVAYERPAVRDFRSAIVKFKEDIPHILVALRDIITETEQTNSQFRDRRNAFLEVCRQSINPEIEVFDIHEMLIQHILTEDIFANIFHESQFHRENNIARELSAIIETFFTGATKRNALKSIEHYYAVIRRNSENIANHHEKQKFLKAVYENFYKAYNPKAADRLGIVYTPNEIVRFMIESTDHLVYKHFGKMLADPGVEILDPCTGTGTYVTELIEYLPKDKLAHKYKNEIHCNEMAILPYYIANLNIEYTYQQKMGVYEEFKNICLVDTLDHCSADGHQFDMFSMSVQNTARIQQQNDRTISVIMGNPPYNAHQDNFNQRNANRAYRSVDEAIKSTYIKEGTAQNQIVVYDMYTRFFRWASDRLGKDGIIAFITNRSFVESKTFDGFRKCVAREFDYVYIVDTQSDVRNNPKISGTKHNVFGIQTGIAVMFLVRTRKDEK
jgi:predicted helicase